MNKIFMKIRITVLLLFIFVNCRSQESVFDFSLFDIKTSTEINLLKHFKNDENYKIVLILNPWLVKDSSFYSDITNGFTKWNKKMKMQFSCILGMPTSLSEGYFRVLKDKFSSIRDVLVLADTTFNDLIKPQKALGIIKSIDNNMKTERQITLPYLLFVNPNGEVIFWKQVMGTSVFSELDMYFSNYGKSFSDLTKTPRAENLAGLNFPVFEYPNKSMKFKDIIDKADYTILLSWNHAFVAGTVLSLPYLIAFLKDFKNNRSMLGNKNVQIGVCITHDYIDGSGLQKAYVQLNNYLSNRMGGDSTLVTFKPIVMQHGRTLSSYHPAVYSNYMNANDFLNPYMPETYNNNEGISEANTIDIFLISNQGEILLHQFQNMSRKKPSLFLDPKSFIQFLNLKK